jgi:2-oxoglutarate ferredoxin oxidoreductase subunit beta
VAAERQIHVEHGKPLRFGANNENGLRVRPGTLDVEVVHIGKDGMTEADVLVHDETNRTMAGLLARMAPPEMPVALGVLYCDPTPSYERQIAALSNAGRRGGKAPDLNSLLRRGHTWTVGAPRREPDGE